MTRRLLFTEDAPPEQARRGPAPSRRSPGTPRSPAGRRRRRSCRPTPPRSRRRSRSRDALRGAAARGLRPTDRLHRRPPLARSVERGNGRRDRPGDQPREPLVIVIGTRPGPIAGGRLARSLERIRLTGLDEAETRQLAAVVAGTELGPSDARAPPRADGRQPAVHHRDRAGDLLDDPVSPTPPAGRLAFGDGGRSGTGMPMTLRALLGARIDALSEEARTVAPRRVGHRRHVPRRRSWPRSSASASSRDVYERPRRGLADRRRRCDADGWRFSHPLIHDAAYWGLLGERPAAPPHAGRRPARGADGPGRDRCRCAPPRGGRRRRAGRAAAGRSRRGGARRRGVCRGGLVLDRRGGSGRGRVRRPTAYRQRARAALEAIPAGRLTPSV